MKAIRYNPTDHTLMDEVEVIDLKPIDDMWYMTDRGYEPIAYLFDPKHKETVEHLLMLYRERLQDLKDYEANLFYNILPKYRIKGE